MPFQDIANSWSYRMRGHELRRNTNANHTTPAMAVLHSNAPLLMKHANDGPPAGMKPMNHSAKSHTKLAAKHPISSSQTRSTEQTCATMATNKRNHQRLRWPAHMDSNLNQTGPPLQNPLPAIEAFQQLA